MNTRAQVARDYAEIPFQPATRDADRALSPAAGIALAVLLGSLCWLGIFALIM